MDAEGSELENKEFQSTSVSATSTSRRRKKTHLQWLIVVAAFFIQLLHSVHIHLTAVLITELAEHFRLSLTVLGTLAALRAGILQFVGIFVGALVNRFGCRAVACGSVLFCATGTFITAFVYDVYSLFLTFGIISAMGAGGLFIPASVIVQQHFGKKRALAAGIASSGLSVGSLMATPVIRQGMEYYGWRGGLIILSAFTVQLMLAAVMFYPAPPIEVKSYEAYEIQKDGLEDEQISSPQVSSCIRSFGSRLASFFALHLFHNKLFVIFLLAAFPLEFGIDIYVYLGISRAIDEGIDDIRASFVNSALGSASIVGRIFSGFVGSISCTNRSLYFGVVVIIAGIIIILSSFAGISFVLHIAFAVIFGLFFGQQHSLYPTVLVDLVSTSGLPKAMGLIQLVKGVAAFVCLPISGALYDLTGSYNASFISMGTVTVAGGVGVLTIVPLARKLKQNISGVDE